MYSKEQIDLCEYRLAEAEELNKQLKASEQMAWVCKMNSIRNRAEEIVFNGLTYN